MSRELRSVIAAHSKSFSLASRLLRPRVRDEVAVLYAWCRRVDDEVDLAPLPERPARVERAYAELASVYAGERQLDPLLAAFQALVTRRAIPERYPRALLDGMRSDLGPVRMADMSELLVYCYRVAGVVGLMLCHVFGLSDPRARENAAHLGIAMQLTNICRDVREDLARGRLYLPADVLASCGGGELGRALVSRAVVHLLETADEYYRSADRGFRALPARAALAARAARLVYAAIGDELRARGGDAFAGRAVVPAWKKLVLVAQAACRELVERVKARFAARRAARGGSLPGGRDDQPLALDA